MNKVSIIIPSYKSTYTLQRAVDSCLEQSYKDIEVIIVDDNNPDSSHRHETEKIMSKYEYDSRVIYIQHARNMNGSAARNTGFNISTGKFICLLDDDDYFMPDKIRKQLDLLLCNKTYDAAGCYWQSRGSIVRLSNKNDFTFELLTGRRTPHTGSLMIKRSAYQRLNGFNPIYTRHQDYEFLIRFFKKFKIFILPDCLLILGTNGIDNRPNAYNLEKVKDQMLLEFRDTYIKNNNFTKQVLASNYVEVFFGYVKQNNKSEATRIFKKLINNSLVYFVKYACTYIFEYIKVNYSMIFIKEKVTKL